MKTLNSYVHTMVGHISSYNLNNTWVREDMYQYYPGSSLLSNLLHIQILE